MYIYIHSNIFDVAASQWHSPNLLYSVTKFK